MKPYGLTVFLLAAVLVPQFAFAQTFTPPPVPQCTLTANPTTILPGARSRLEWTSRNASRGTLTGIGNIPANSSVYVMPRVTTDYRATFEGPGGTRTCTVRVTVIGSGAAPVGGSSSGDTTTFTLQNNGSYLVTTNSGVRLVLESDGTYSVQAAGSTNIGEEVTNIALESGATITLAPGGDYTATTASGAPVSLESIVGSAEVGEAQPIGTISVDTDSQSVTPTPSYPDTQTLTPTTVTPNTVDTGGFPTGGNVFNPTTGSSISEGSNLTGLVTCQGFRDCNLCKFVAMIQKIINWLLAISVLIAAIMFAWAGILYFSANGNPNRITRAHNVFKMVALGFVLALAGYLVVQTIVNAVVKPNFFQSGMNWNSIGDQCNRQRQYDAKVQEWLNSSLPGLSSGSTGGAVTSTGSCPTGYQPLMANSAQCINDAGDIVNRTQPTNSGTTGASGTDLDNRALLTNNNISVVSTGNCADKSNSRCTSLDGVNTGLISDLITMRNSGLNFAVSGGTEVGHSSSAQQTGNSVDLSGCNSTNGFDTASAVAGCIQQFSTAANNVGRRLDYECQTASQTQQITSALGTLPQNTRVITVGYATGSGNFPCHFSIY